MFIYLLRLIIAQYENAFKIGCTENYEDRLPSYSTSLGPIEYKAEIIKINNVPDKIKLKYKNRVGGEHRLCNYAEALLHDYYKNYRIINPTSNYETEFFESHNPKPCINDIENILKINKIEYEMGPKYPFDENHIKTIKKMHLLK